MAADTNALRWTSADVLTDVRRRAALPTTSTDWTDTVLLREATDAIWNFAAWAQSLHAEGRLVAQLDRQPADLLTSSYRAATEIQMPPLAVADAIDSVAYLDENGRTVSRLVRVDVCEEGNLDTVDSSGAPQGYSILGGRIRFYPKPTRGGSFRITYQRRHGELVVDSPATVGTVTAATGTVTTQLTLSAAITGLTTADNVDLVLRDSPHRGVATAASVVSVAGAALELGIPFSAFNGQSLVSARVVRTGQTPYVSMPFEMRSALNEKITSSVLRAVGDLTSAQVAEQMALSEMSRVMQLLSPRARRDKPRAVNPFSHMRLSTARGRW